MAYRYEVHPRCCVYVVFSGPLLATELAAYFQEVRRDPAVPVSLPRLIDLRQVTDVPTPLEIRALAEVLCREDMEPIWRAFIASGPFHAYTFRVLEEATSGCDVVNRAFTTPEEAAAWLGIRLPPGIE